MAANVTPIFTLTPNFGRLSGSVANTNLDGTTGTYYTFFTAGAFGSRVDMIRYTLATTSTAGVIRIFHDNGTDTPRLLKVFIVPALVPSTTQEPASEDWVPKVPLVLGAAELLIFNTNNAELVIVYGFGGDY